MRYYAGLDVSLEETAICVVDETGKVIRELRAASEPDALVETLAATGLSFERVGLEACSLSSWLHQGTDALRLARAVHRGAGSQGGNGCDAE
ncbi:MAG: transposase [Bradyrhizobium sp.]|nr:transposase [Bradyrhizobium sp.]